MMFIGLFHVVRVYINRRARRLRMFDNVMLRKIFGLNREESIEDRRKLHNEELQEILCERKN